MDQRFLLSLLLVSALSLCGVRCGGCDNRDLARRAQQAWSQAFSPVKKYVHGLDTSILIVKNGCFQLWVLIDLVHSFITLSNWSFLMVLDLHYSMISPKPSLEKTQIDWIEVANIAWSKSDKQLQLYMIDKVFRLPKLK